MQTCCPYCDTHFNIAQDIVEALDARVRCGECRTVFNARDRLLVKTSTEEVQRSRLPIETTPDTQGGARSSRFDFDRLEDVGMEMDDTLRIEDETPDQPPTPLTHIQAASDSESIVENSGLDSLDFDPQPDIFASSAVDSKPPETSGEVDEAFTLLARRPIPRRRSSGRWIAGSFVLLILIAVQWLYLNRDTVLVSPGIRPGIQLACAYLGCELEPLRDLEQIELLRRSVYSHPNIEDALIISLAMVNNANYEQTFPVLLIRMADVRGQIVAERNFQPADYLDETIAASEMAPGVPVTVTLEIHDPGNDALTFELEFQ